MSEFRLKSNAGSARMKHLKGNELAVFEARINNLLIRKRIRPKLIDLFSGAGGLSLGFSRRFGHCFEPIWANDINDWMVSTYNRNLGEHCISGDLNDLLADPTIEIPTADVVIGGPPCQGFSLLNKNRDGDLRKQLWRPFLDVVERAGASIFLMENVPPLIKSPEYEEIKAVTSDMGFMVRETILCAADYGVSQKRYRAFILGCKFVDPVKVFPPKRTHYNHINGNGIQADFNRYVDDPEPWRSVKDEINDLDPPQGTEIRDVDHPYDLHFGRNPTPKSLARYRTIPEEGMNRFDLQERAPHLTPDCWIKKKSGGTDLFGRLWWNRPALTIRTEFFKPEKGRYLHPQQHRPITHREAARFQSFPDDFKFIGSKVEIAIQIGNAVPPRLAARVADSVYALWLAKPK
jgi:DNA (cytosine-5)-methyltransferase 1